MFWDKETPLMHCTVRHELPGRLRIDCRGLRYLDAYAEDIRIALEASDAIVCATVSVITGNVLITFDQEQLHSSDALALVSSVLGSWSLSAYKAERSEHNTLTVQERRLQEEPISETLTRIGITTVSLAFAWLRPGPMPATFAGRLLTMPALTSLSLAWPILKSGANSLVTTKRPNADTLSSSAIISSVLAGQSMSALTIIWLADIAELLTAYTMERTRKAIREMLAVGEDRVWRLREDDSEEQVPLEALRPGDRVLAHTGEKISVDGVVESGEAAVDQASITGEFMPVHKGADNAVFAGTVVKTGRLVVRAREVGDKTAVARIVHLVEEASHRKAPIQNIADRVSAQFIPINFLLAGVVYFATGKVSRALNMLIIDYSCGVRLSTATALSASICNAARSGILIKGGNFLELLAESDTVVLDKTGTMTEGRPTIKTVVTASPDIMEREVLEMAAAAEEASTHPMAVAVLERVRRAGWKTPAHKDNQLHTALGVSTRVGEYTIRVGSRRYMDQNHIALTQVDEQAHAIARKGENLVYVARDTELLGVLGIYDSLREDMKKALNRMRLLGVDDIVLLTGDVEQHAEVVAARMAMDRYHAEVLPDDKAETVLKLQSKGIRVVMVGDGINDAPALAYADVGIAMGGARTDIAMEAADITLTSDNPLMIPAVMRLARHTMDVVRQNFVTAIGVNTVGIVLASIGVLPVFWGAVLHNASTVAVVVNSARLLVHDVEKGK